MAEIDWSKAPEWADSIWLGALSQLPYWVNAESGRTQRLADEFTGGVFDAEHWTKVADRPQWNGEGKPPVGTVCEVMSARSGCDWVECRIVAHDGELAVYRTEDGRYDADLELLDNNPKRRLFRPIRTEAQIAAEDLQLAAQKIMVDAGITDSAFKDDPEAWVWASALHKAGYRKQEPKP